ncbi:unnamed protein product [Onchocerca ochengi]|uniref:ZP domain-containing protein n=1 Tax=Onchocerca ochengi TaxID=42157 RepID=A0A182EQW2_ONCOC|nr:unnamed protein product [Onchocerca ochengi]
MLKDIAYSISLMHGEFGFSIPEGACIIHLSQCYDFCAERRHLEVRIVFLDFRALQLRYIPVVVPLDTCGFSLKSRG